MTSRGPQMLHQRYYHIQCDHQAKLFSCYSDKKHNKHSAVKNTVALAKFFCFPGLCIQLLHIHVNSDTAPPFPFNPDSDTHSKGDNLLLGPLVDEEGPGARLMTLKIYSSRIFHTPVPIFVKDGPPYSWIIPLYQSQSHLRRVNPKLHPKHDVRSLKMTTMAV